MARNEKKFGTVAHVCRCLILKTLFSDDIIVSIKFSQWRLQHLKLHTSSCFQSGDWFKRKQILPEDNIAVIYLNNTCTLFQYALNWRHACNAWILRIKYFQHRFIYYHHSIQPNTSFQLSEDAETMAQKCNKIHTKFYPESKCSVLQECCLKPGVWYKTF